MIPKSNIYSTSTVSPAHSRADVEELLEKFDVKKFAWKRDEPENSFLIFERTEKFTGNERNVMYKVSIPFIEKSKGGSHNKRFEYDEIRSYRIMYHILKHLLLNTDIGMEFEQAFGNYIVIGKQPNGDPMSIQDKIGTALANNELPALV